MITKRNDVRCLERAIDARTSFQRHVEELEDMEKRKGCTRGWRTGEVSLIYTEKMIVFRKNYDKSQVKLEGSSEEAM